jgi:hypothetical protein
LMLQAAALSSPWREPVWVNGTLSVLQRMRCTACQNKSNVLQRLHASMENLPNAADGVTLAKALCTARGSTAGEADTRNCGDPHLAIISSEAYPMSRIDSAGAEPALLQAHRLSRCKRRLHTRSRSRDPTCGRQTTQNTDRICKVVNARASTCTIGNSLLSNSSTQAVERRPERAEPGLSQLSCKA